MESEAKVGLMIAQARKLGDDVQIAALELSLKEMQEKRTSLVEVAKLEIARDEVDVKRIAATNKGSTD